MFTTISASRLSAGSIYKLWLIGLGASMLPLGVLFGVLAAFGFNTVVWNGEALHGLSGLVGGPLLGLFIALVFTGFLGTASAFGLWLYSKVRPISLSVKQVA